MDDPNSPFVVAAVAVARRSIGQVVLLHVTARPDRGQPQASPVSVAKSLRRELADQIADATMLVPPAGTPAADLVVALRDYRRLAGQLRRAGSGSPPALPDAFFDRLAQVDRRWLAALEAVGKVAGEDLRALVPERAGLVLP